MKKAPLMFELEDDEKQIYSEFAHEKRKSEQEATSILHLITVVSHYNFNYIKQNRSYGK